MEKHCNTCRHSYRKVETKAYLSESVLMEHCKSSRYNSSEYTPEMRMEDWDKDYCRFWESREETNK